jgi:hypothetical protein
MGDASTSIVDNNTTILMMAAPASLTLKINWVMKTM